MFEFRSLAHNRRSDIMSKRDHALDEGLHPALVQLLHLKAGAAHAEPPLVTAGFTRRTRPAARLLGGLILPWLTALSRG